MDQPAVGARLAGKRRIDFDVDPDQDTGLILTPILSGSVSACLVRQPSSLWSHWIRMQFLSRSQVPFSLACSSLVAAADETSG